jgi:hypothetical protein
MGLAHLALLVQESRKPTASKKNEFLIDRGADQNF